MRLLKKRYGVESSITTQRDPPCPPLPKGGIPAHSSPLLPNASCLMPLLVFRVPVALWRRGFYFLVGPRAAEILGELHLSMIELRVRSRFGQQFLVIADLDDLAAFKDDQ